MPKVAICGIGNSLKNFDYSSDYEVWGLNHKHAYKSLDLFFNPHIKEEIKGVITQANFPFDEVYQLRKIPIVNRNTRYRYFASSMSYMTAYAILKGYDVILFCGCDFNTKDVKRTKQKECLEQWIAFAQGRGINIKVIADSPLFDETGLYIYGRKTDKI